MAELAKVGSSFGQPSQRFSASLGVPWLPESLLSLQPQLRRVFAFCLSGCTPVPQARLPVLQTGCRGS